MTRLDCYYPFWLGGAIMLFLRMGVSYSMKDDSGRATLGFVKVC